jgi:hypothetical protein
MRNGNIFTVYFVGMGWRMKRQTRRIDVGYQLVSEEIEVDPLSIRSAFCAAEKSAVELSGGGQIMDGDCQMERCWHGSRSGFISTFE